MKRLIIAILAVTAALLVVARIRRDRGDRALEVVADEARKTLEHFKRG